MGLTRVFMFLAVWGLLLLANGARAEIVIGAGAGGDEMGAIGGVDESEFEGDINEEDAGGDCDVSPGTGSIYDSVESPPMTGGGVIDLLGIHDRRPVACFARNARGEVFNALGARPAAVQERAMRKCEAASRRCRPLGCHRLM